MTTQLQKSIISTCIVLATFSGGTSVFAAQVTTPPATQVPVSGNTVQAISYNTLSPKTVELVVTFSRRAVVPKAYQIEQPSRLVLDFTGVSPALADKFLRVNRGIVQSVAVNDSPGVTRFVINLNEVGDYTSKIDGNTFTLKLSRKPGSSAGVTSFFSKKLPSATSAAPAVTPATSQATTPVTPLAPALPATAAPAPAASQPAQKSGSSSATADNRISDISFKRGGANEGQVLVRLADPNAPVDVKRTGSRITIRFLGSRLPDRLIRRLIVDEFGTPVKSVESYNDGRNGVVNINGAGDYDFYSLKNNGNLVVGIKPVVEDRTKAPPKENYNGKKITLEFQDIEVRYVLQMLADFNNFNLVASDTVKGNISIQLKNVPWDQALDIILKSKNLDKRLNGNVLLVAPADEIATREKQELQNARQTEQLLPLQTVYIRLSYAKAEDLRKLLTSSGSSSGSSSGGGSGSADGASSMLSPRGKVFLDTRTNTLVIQDTQDRVDMIRNMVEKLDVPVRQVMIEARIVRATDNFSKELGVKWGVLSQGVSSNNNMLVGGSDTTLWNLKTPTTDTTTGRSTYTIERPQNLSVDLGVASAGASRIAFGLLKLSDVMLDLELSALQSDGRGEIVATPKVLTGDKQKARIASGTQIPYQQSTASGATSIAFINAELSLEVTPSITPDSKIGLELLVSNDTPGDVQASGVRAIETNRVSTNVLVEDGQTVVLGGIFQNQLSSSMYKTPFLGDIPYVGRVFRKEAKTNAKQELLIFVTPKLMGRVAGSI